jgi:hypothetical protein
MRKIGIDPGVSGAIVVLYNGQPAESYRMPIMKIGSTSRVNASALAAMIRPYSKRAEAASHLGMLINIIGHWPQIKPLLPGFRCKPLH